MKNITTPIASLVAAGMLFSGFSSHACTSLLLPTKDGSYVYGRTMEFGFDLDSKGGFVPRGLKVQAEGPKGVTGKSWTTKYAVIGLNAFGMAMIVDGMNEKGLAGGILYYAGFAEYTDAKDAIDGQVLAPWEFLSWALTNFATVGEVKDAISQVQVVGEVLPALKIAPPFHYTLHDANGDSIVVEPTGGKLVVHENPYGVLTNGPSFPWHVTNMQTYIKMSPVNAPPLKVAGQTITNLGQGSGWLGIPGDPTPPSRLIRALAYSMTTNPKPSGIESVRLMEHIMNNFDIPYGFIQDASGGHFDYTQWTAISDIGTGRYYVKTYDNPNLMEISFSDFDLDADAPVTKELKPDLAATKLFDQ